MKNRIFVLTTLGFLAATVACNQQTTPEMSATTTAAETPAPAYSPAAICWLPSGAGVATSIAAGE